MGRGDDLSGWAVQNLSVTVTETEFSNQFVVRGHGLSKMCYCIVPHLTWPSLRRKPSSTSRFLRCLLLWQRLLALVNFGVLISFLFYIRFEKGGVPPNRWYWICRCLTINNLLLTNTAA